MTHVRQTIREAAATALSGSTDAGTRVHSSLVYPSERSELPLIYVHVDSEESGLAGIRGPLSRTASLVITAVADATEATLDNTLDALAADIESVIGSNEFAVAKQTVLASTEITRSTEGTKPTAAISLTYSVVYHTAEDDAETAL